MALIYFVIFVCAFSNVICDQYTLGDDETIINIYILYLVGFAMLLMLLIIIYLCYILYKLKRSFIYENKTSLNIEQLRNDGSTQTLYSGITEIKEINEPTMGVCIEENKTPIVIKKSLGPKMEIIPKQQMDKIITEVLNRKQRSESGTFRDLIALTKRKSIDSGVNKILFNRKLNKIDTNIDVKAKEDLYGNSPVKDEKSPNFNDKIVEKTVIKEEGNETDLIVLKTLKKLDVPDGIVPNTIEQVVEVNNAVPTLPVKVDGINDAVPNPVLTVDDIYDTVPNPVLKASDVYDTVPNIIVKVDDVYDTVPNIVVKVDDVYDTVSNIVVKVDDVYDTVPNKVLKVDDLYDTVPNFVVKVDDVYDTLPERVKTEENNGDDTQIPDVNIVPTSSNQDKVRAILDSDTGYALLLHEESQENARYMNANDIL